jgi:hypothetical protein
MGGEAVIGVGGEGGVRRLSTESVRQLNICIVWGMIAKQLRMGVVIGVVVIVLHQRVVCVESDRA